MIVVEWSWDAVEGRVPLKHREEGEDREVPIFPALRPILEGQLASLGPAKATDLFLPGSGRWGDRIGAGQPFSAEAYLARARDAWGDRQPLGLHEARHSFASWLVLAGYDVATIAEWLGHAQVSTTLDRCRRLVRQPPWNAEAVSAGAVLARSGHVLRRRRTAVAGRPRITRIG